MTKAREYLERKKDKTTKAIKIYGKEIISIASLTTFMGLEGILVPISPIVGAIRGIIKHQNPVNALTNYTRNVNSFFCDLEKNTVKK